MKNKALRLISISVCFFLIASCSHEKQFTQKRYDKLQKAAVNSDGANYCNSNKIPEKSKVITAEDENYVPDKNNDLLSYIPENKNSISTSHEEALIPFILKKATKKLSVSNSNDVKKQNYKQDVKKSDTKAAPRGGRGHDFWNIAITCILIICIALAVYLIITKSK
ncbi:MAG: hypothetical protein WC223_05845 [Bacteroidales bacterium]|jgi:hypothetical protein